MELEIYKVKTIVFMTIFSILVSNLQVLNKNEKTTNYEKTILSYLAFFLPIYF